MPDLDKPEHWMQEARQLAAQCWTDAETSNREMDTALAEAVAKRIAAWMSTAAQASRGQEFYRDLVVKCGENFGVAAKTSDDGSIQDHVLALKVPELVERAVMERAKLRFALSHLVGSSTVTELKKLEPIVRAMDIPEDEKAKMIVAIHTLIAIP